MFAEQVVKIVDKPVLQLVRDYSTDDDFDDRPKVVVEVRYPADAPDPPHRKLERAVA